MPGLLHRCIGLLHLHKHCFQNFRGPLQGPGFSGFSSGLSEVLALLRIRSRAVLNCTLYRAIVVATLFVWFNLVYTVCRSYYHSYFLAPSYEIAVKKLLVYLDSFEV